MHIIIGGKSILKIWPFVTENHAGVALLQGYNVEGNPFFKILWQWAVSGITTGGIMIMYIEGALYVEIRWSHLSYCIGKLLQENFVSGHRQWI